MPPGPPSAEPIPTLRQLFPEPRQIHIAELLQTLELSANPSSERPYTIVNFVSSADGRAAFQNRSRWLSDDADREMFHGLREHVDAVLVGTGTLRVERYGRLVRDAERRERRVAAGLRADPLGCIISRSGEVPLDIPLFADPDSRVVVFTSTELDTSGVAADVDVVRLDAGELTPTTMMRQLRSAYGVQTVLCEGGPNLFASLLRECLVDELFLSLAAKLNGGGVEPAITTGPELPELRALRLLWALEHDSALYLRYAVA